MLARLGIAYMVVAITLAGFPVSAFAQASMSTDIKINGSDGPVTITNGETWNYSWTSDNATACQINTPTGTSGITLSGNDGPIDPGHDWYPAVGGSTTLTISCTDGVDTTTDSATIHIVAADDDDDTPPATGGDVEVDIKIENSDGPVTITNGESWDYSWTSNGATSCQLTSPTGTSGITLSGNDGPIDPGHDWYPAVGGSTTLTISCTDGVNSATDSAVISLVTGSGSSSDDVDADIKINGSDGPVTITDGESWNYSWTSDDATSCQLTSPTGTSGITLSGNDGPIDPDHPWYPNVGGSTTLTISCTDGTDTATDSAVIRVEDEDNGGGGGGSSNRRSRARVTADPVTSPAVVGNFCPYLTSYMRIDFNNDRMQVIRLQAFLNTVEGHNYVNITGVFDEATRQAVSAFQLKYSSEVLSPWGIDQSTGYVYITTLRKINEILCGPQPAYTLPQAQEIENYVPPKEGAPIEVGSKAGGKELGFGSTTTGPYVPIIGETNTKGQNSNDGLAAVLFATPQDFSGLMQCLYEFLLILVVLYIIGSVLENVLYKDVPENVRKKFYTKWTAISLGLVAAIVGAYLLGRWCLILPLLLALLASVAWMFLYPKHGAIKTSTKTWYQTNTVKASTLWNDKDARGNEPPKEAMATDSGAKK